MSQASFREEAIQLAKQGFPNHDIRQFLENIGCPAYTIETIMLEVDDLYPSRKPKRKIAWDEIVHYFGFAFVMFTATYVTVQLAERLYYIPCSLGLFAVILGMVKIFEKR